MGRSGNGGKPVIPTGYRTGCLVSIRQGFDVGTRDLKLDEALGLNCVWYADILMTLTAD